MSDHARPWKIGEIQIFARGVAGKATYTADILDFGQPAVWGEMRWSLKQEPESLLYVRTRNGGSSQLFRYWKYTGMGDHKVEVSQEEYEQLRKSQRAEPTYNYDSWNPWTSRFHLVEGGDPPPVFPVPRRSFQFSLEFVSSGEEGTRLEFLEFRASAAAVARVVGELDPIRVKAGAMTRFTYALRPRIHEEDPGFDLLEIRAVAARIDAVQAVLIDGAEVPFQVLELGDRRAVLGIPRVAGLAYSDAIVEVLFDAQVLRFGGAFMGQIADSERPHDVPQPVLSGDAIDEAFGDRVWIETSTAVESALEARAEPDGVHPERGRLQRPGGDRLRPRRSHPARLRGGGDPGPRRPAGAPAALRGRGDRQVPALVGRPPRRRRPGAPRHLPLPGDDNRCLRRTLFRGRPPAGRLLRELAPRKNRA